MAGTLGGFEQAVLLAIVRPRDYVYGRAILDEAQKRLGYEVSAGAVQATLERLERKRLCRVSAGFGHAGPGRSTATLLSTHPLRSARAQRGACRRRPVMAGPRMATEEPILTSVIPPAWAERVLRLVVRHDHFADVAGDLLETYRDTIHPTRGRRRADRCTSGRWQNSSGLPHAPGPFSSA